MIRRLVLLRHDRSAGLVSPLFSSLANAGWKPALRKERRRHVGEVNAVPPFRRSSSSAFAFSDRAARSAPVRRLTAAGPRTYLPCRYMEVGDARARSQMGQQRFG